MTPEMLQVLYMIGSALAGWAVRHYFGGSPAPAPATPESGVIRLVVDEMKQHLADVEAAAMKAKLVQTVMDKPGLKT